MSNRVIRWKARPDDARARLDQFIVQRWSEQSRSQIRSWIKQGLVRVNGTAAKAGYSLHSGDEITVAPPETTRILPFAEPIPLQFHYQDETLAVVEKPAGLVCHLGAGIQSGTLVNALLHHFGPLETGDPLRPGIVHRLDKDASGLVVIAKNRESHQALSQQFKDRTVQKEYLALVYGQPSSAHGTITFPLGRDSRNRKKISVRSRSPRTALSEFEVDSVYHHFALLKVRIQTGRTHQIRVHLSHSGHPIVGDDVYGANRNRTIANASLKTRVVGLGRLFLHAHRLCVRHPQTNREMEFRSPLPPRLVEFLETLSRADS